jgi:hypothetical protein
MKTRKSFALSASIVMACLPVFSAVGSPPPVGSIDDPFATRGECLHALAIFINQLRELQTESTKDLRDTYYCQQIGDQWFIVF